MATSFTFSNRFIWLNLHLSKDNLQSYSRISSADRSVSLISQRFFTKTLICYAIRLKSTVNQESIFARSALKATTFRDYMKRQNAPILVQGGPIILDLDELSATNVTGTGW